MKIMNIKILKDEHSNSKYNLQNGSKNLIITRY